ncbi:hypothetical protein QP866_05955, partial [Corynebacterium imitans]|uniref:hypothetical protein n=1 Tax=Corynebacterium imitans TaxID=156978 RepID=UPI002549D2FA
PGVTGYSPGRYSILTMALLNQWSEQASARPNFRLCGISLAVSCMTDNIEPAETAAVDKQKLPPVRN